MVHEANLHMRAEFTGLHGLPQILCQRCNELLDEIDSCSHEGDQQLREASSIESPRRIIAALGALPEVTL